MRYGAGIGMAELGETKKDMVVLAADTAESSRAHYFAKKFPERFIQCGVAEQNLIGISAGLSYHRDARTQPRSYEVTAQANGWRRH